MKNIMMAATLLAGFGAVRAQDAPEMPKPQKEHEWLHQLVGEWETDAEFTMDPAKPPMKSKGSESGRMVGGFWAVLENKGEFLGKPFTGILTLGFDAEKKKYVATWVDSVMPVLWNYQGTLDGTGKILTLETEGFCPEQPGKLTKFKETLEIKSADHKIFTSMREMDGKWVTGGVIQYRRKK